MGLKSLKITIFAEITIVFPAKFLCAINIYFKEKSEESNMRFLM